MTPATAQTPSGPRQLLPLTPDRRLDQPSQLSGPLATREDSAAPRNRGFRLGDATPSSRFLLVLVAASVLLAVAFARASAAIPHSLQ